MATTPSAVRQATQPLNTRSHSTRTVRTALAAQIPPAAPVFLEQPLFLNALAGPSHAHQPSPGPASVPMQATRIDPAGFAAAGNGAAGAKSFLKRRVVELSDDDAEAEAGTAARQIKRSRAVSTLSASTLNTAATATSTTQDAKRRSRKSTVDRAAEKEKMAHESQQWRQKYRKAFPSFTFYFDAIDEATKASLGQQVKKLGASVDNFFSKKVTHVVTSRPVPSATGKENLDSPAAGKLGAPLDSAAGKAKRASSARSPKMYELPNGQKIRPLAGDFEKNPFIDSQDILSKALDFGLKIWGGDKLQLILTRINHHSPNKDKSALQRDPSLPTLLRDEQLYGTRERDPFAPRNDTYYFPANRFYLLVEDSTGEHRPVVIKEYDKPRKHEDPSWPVLWGGVEGRTGFYHYDGPDIHYERRVPPAAPLAPAPAAAADVAGKSGYGSTAARAIAPNLRRAVSLQNVARAGQRGYDPALAAGAGAGGYHRRDSYIAASGNSQIITSNIASATSTAARSGAAQASRFGPNGSLVDKRLAVLSNRTVSVAGGALLGSGTSAAGSSGLARVKQQSGATAGRAGLLTRSVSVDGALHPLRVPVVPAALARDEPKKPGYCENCRVKYDDFKDHVVSSKHRRFALNPKNWADLDRLLAQIDRPLAPLPASDDGAEPDYEVDDSGFFDMDAAEACADGDDSDKSSAGL